MLAASPHFSVLALAPTPLSCAAPPNPALPLLPVPEDIWTPDPLRPHLLTVSGNILPVVHDGNPQGWWESIRRPVPGRTHPVPPRYRLRHVGFSGLGLHLEQGVVVVCDSELGASHEPTMQLLVIDPPTPRR